MKKIMLLIVGLIVVVSSAGSAFAAGISQDSKFSMTTVFTPPDVEDSMFH
jgi:hypothetical protein